MTNPEEAALIIVRLIIAHIISDFLLQPGSWVASRYQKKWKSTALLYHVLITAGLAYLLAGKWQLWQIPLFIGVSHWIIDVIRSYLPNRWEYFALDQALHALVIFLIGDYILLSDPWLLNGLSGLAKSYQVMVVLLAYSLIIWPEGVLIGQATQRYQKISLLGQGLPQAGKWIGRLERILILTFVLFQQYQVIGFLITSKSIFRITQLSEKRERLLIEYILLGTLMSFTVAILTGLACQWALDLF